MDALSNKRIRLEYIDVVRGICILFMIMGHIGFGDIFGKWVHAFHMPIFFVTSGIFFDYGSSVSSFLKKKAHSLLLPYLFFGVACFSISSLIGVLKGESITFEAIRHFFFDNTSGMGLMGALWFLTSLFVSELVFFFIKRINNSCTEIILILFISFMGCIIPSIFPFTLPWGIEPAMVGVGFLFVGYCFRRTKLWTLFDKRLSRKDFFFFLFAFLILILFSAFSLINESINMREGLYTFIPIFWINSIGIIIPFLLIIKYLLKVRFVIFIFRPFFSFLKYVGINSIVYLGLNQPIIALFNLIATPALSVYLIKIVLFCLVVVLLSILSLLLIKSPLKFLIGKKI